MSDVSAFEPATARQVIFDLKANETEIRKTEISGQLSDTKTIPQHFSHSLHFFSGQNSKSSLEFDCGNGLDLLQMKRARF